MALSSQQHRPVAFWWILAALYLAATMIFFGFRFHLVSPLFNSFVFVTEMLSLMVVIPLLLLLDFRKRYVQILLYVMTHVTSAIILVYIAGADNLFDVFWLLLMAVWFLYLGMTGFYISAAIFIGGSAVSNYLRPIPEGVRSRFDLVVPGFIISVFVCMCAYVVIRILQQLQESRRRQMRAQQHETLQRERLSTLINTMTDAVLSIDDHGKILVYNAAVMSLLDTNSDLQTKDLADILKLYDEDGKAVDIMAHILKAKDTFSRRDLSYKYSATDSVDLYISVSPLHPNYHSSGGGHGYILIMRDITKEKSLEEERSEFISVISHELRTPIAITEGDVSNAQFIVDKTGDKDQIKAALNAAHEQILFLAGIVNDLSVLSQAERETLKVEIEPIDIRKLMKSLQRDYHEDAARKGLKITAKIDPEVKVAHSSALYVEEIMQNFITNAIKYSDKGTIIIAAKHDPRGVLLSVTDTGIGLSKSDQKKIFTKFFRSEDFRTRANNGTGLGLYIAAKLASLIHSEIVLESELNVGSTFSFVVSDLEK